MTLSAIERLEKAYFELLENEHYSKITVSELIAKAGVSRTTFYRYYVDIFDMHKKVSEKMGAAIVRGCLEKVICAKSEQECFDSILKIFYSQEKYIVLLAGKNGSRYFFEGLYRKTTEEFFPSFTNLSEEQLFRLRFMTLSMIGTYVKDMIEGREHNPKFITVCKKVLNFEKTLGGYYGEQC